ncbi:hypothetical protein [Kribbella speibonae]|uniref:Uncharacterized protein n=1 Tax=Kribbella speibonae TaxID=1572660 RepID=A0ABY2A923_9ACTN|nr:hypothetical protein [Kribbella speibonae]TCC25400.1 hypothetical protein E0H58_14725 [Kribbella speibonae]
MTKQQPLSKDELAATYPDEEWRAKLLTISNYVDMLHACILRRDYRVPDDLNAAVTLSEAGKRVQLTLAKVHKVNPKDARILCLLEYDHVDLLIDVENMDLEALGRSIERQILDGDIRFPFTFGRELYDRATALFRHETWSLTYEDTMRLLDGSSKGVFQIQDMVAGPYGILPSAETRWMMPKRRVPLFHCSDITCDEIHRCELSSDSSAPVNLERPKIVQVLNQISEESSDWQGFLADVAGLDGIRYDDRSREALPFLLGDGLSDRELQILISTLMDTTKGDLRQRLAPLGIAGASEDAVRELSRAQLIQVALLCRNVDIADQLDRLVASSRIVVPTGELRRPVLNAGYAIGVYGIRPELSTQGVRFVPSTVQICQLRLRRLIGRLYDLESASDRAELEFQLRDVDGVNVESQLEEFIRSATPEDVLTRLMLARHVNVVTASQDLAVDVSLHGPDPELIGSMLWKLGFKADRGEDVNREFWLQHVGMKKLTQTADVSAVTDPNAVRSLASNYFVALEGLLDDSLAYCSWALTSDHLGAQRPFTFQPEADGLAALMRLNEAERSRPSGPEKLTFSDANELYGLCRGFSALAEWLQVLQADRQNLRRSSADYPASIKHSDLRKFPFKHTVAFLDLIDSARVKIPQTLKEISRILISAKVSDVRNEWFHYRKSTADVGRLAACLAGIEQAVDMLEREGLCRVQFVPVRDSGDIWGRRIFFLADSRGREIGIARPVRYDISQMPGLRQSQYLMNSAVFAEPREMLRFNVSVSSEYSAMWDDYPVRRQEGKLPVDARIPSDPLKLGGSSPMIAG